jgi:phage terminase large subunit-like protein
MRVAEVHIIQGDSAVLEVTDRLLEIAGRRPIAELAFDPWRYQAEALRLERDHGVNAVGFPQSHSRMTAASENLHRVIVEGKLTHPGDPDLDAHVAAAVARQTGRGWRLDKLTKEAQIDGVIALAMACERAEARPEPVRVLAWL